MDLSYRHLPHRCPTRRADGARRPSGSPSKLMRSKNSRKITRSSSSLASSRPAATRSTNPAQSNHRGWPTPQLDCGASRLMYPVQGPQTPGALIVARACSLPRLAPRSFLSLGIIGSLGFPCHPGTFRPKSFYRLSSHQRFFYRAPIPITRGITTLPSDPVIASHASMQRTPARSADD